MGVGVGEFKSIRFSLMEGAGGGMLPLVEVLPGVGAGTGGGPTVPLASGPFSKCAEHVHVHVATADLPFLSYVWASSSSSSFSHYFSPCG